VVAMQATWSQPVAEVVVFSNGFASRRERRGTRGRPRLARRSGRGGTPAVRRPSGPGAARVAVPEERAGSGCGDPTVHQDQLRPLGDALPGRVPEVESLTF